MAYDPMFPRGNPVTEPPAEDKALGQLVGEVVSEMGTLVRQEIALAKVETKEELSKAAKAGGMFGAVAVTGHMALLFLSLALAWLLSQAINLAASFAIVGILYALRRSCLLWPPRSRRDHQSRSATDRRNLEGGCAVGQSAEELRDQIAATREDLGVTVDAISDHVNPARIVQRRKDRISSRWSAARESVMGSVSDLGGSSIRRRHGQLRRRRWL